MVTLKLLFLVLVFTKLAGRNSGEYASLALSTSKDPQPGHVNVTYCAVYNPSYAPLPVGNDPSAGQFHEASLEDFGCTDFPAGLHENSSVIVDRGNCNFYDKALMAQRANASMLLVVYNESMISSVPLLVPDNNQSESDPTIVIPVLFIGSDTGEMIKGWLNTTMVYLSVMVPSSPPFDPGSAVLFCIAVGTVLMAAFLANIPFHFLRYGLLIREGMETSQSDEGGGSTGRRMTVVTMLIGLVIMVCSTCALLLLLYFFYSPMVYIVLALYCVASVFGLYSLISPFMALIPLGDNCRIPRNKFPILRYQPNILFFLTVLFCVGVVSWWVAERHSSYAWVLQDILGFAFITMLLSRLRFLKAWFVAVLMIMLFVYDIFMVFITPYFTHDGVSVMEKAATGPAGGNQELLPVVFLVPKLLNPTALDTICAAYITSRPASLLGYGDVGIPGLLVTLCLKFDLHFRKGKKLRIYYATCGIAYTIGLAITYLALTLMQTAQPALLYLVPTTLGSVTLLSLIRKEFTLFFTNRLSTAQQKSTDTQPSTFASNADAAINTADSDAENETQVMDHNEKTLLLSDNEETSNTHT